MAGPNNKMNRLLDKVERRLGVKQLNLPDYLSKDIWAREVIQNETLDTFSRFFPNTLLVTVDNSMKTSDGWYVLDKYLDDNTELLGVRDIDWGTFSQDALSVHHANGYGIYSVLPTDYSMDDIMAIQMRADMTSMFDNQIYVDFKPPNKVKLTSVMNNDVTRGMKSFPVTLLIKHAPNLMTISPTMMETFEELAEADIARFLYENLKYYEGLETVYANMDMKLGDLESKASKRDEVVTKLDEAHVSFANEAQPMIFTV